MKKRTLNRRRKSLECELRRLLDEIGAGNDTARTDLVDLLFKDISETPQPALSPFHRNQITPFPELRDGQRERIGWLLRHSIWQFEDDTSDFFSCSDIWFEDSLVYLETGQSGCHDGNLDFIGPSLVMGLVDIALRVEFFYSDDGALRCDAPKHCPVGFVRVQDEKPDPEWLAQLRDAADGLRTKKGFPVVVEDELTEVSFKWTCRKAADGFCSRCGFVPGFGHWSNRLIPESG